MLCTISDFCYIFVIYICDHLLSCCHGPVRVRRHNALCEIIFHALLSDCKNVKLEQRCSGEDGRRPGDVYHPEFLEGKAGYFDISIRKSLQPSYVTKSAIRAGAAAEAGELAATRPVLLWRVVFSIPWW